MKQGIKKAFLAVETALALLALICAGSLLIERARNFSFYPYVRRTLQAAGTLGSHVFYDKRVMTYQWKTTGVKWQTTCTAIGLFVANRVPPVGTVQQGPEGEFILVSMERRDLPLWVTAGVVLAFMCWYAYAVFRHESRWGPLAPAKHRYSKAIMVLVMAWGIAATTHLCVRVIERIGTHMSKEAYYTVMQ